MIRCSPVLPASASSRNAKLVVLVLRVGELAHRIDVLPRPGVERVLGVGDGRGGILGIEGDAKRLARSADCSQATGCLDGLEVP